MLESLPELKNIFVTYPYVELGVFNSEELKKNGGLVANAQGGNRAPIIEWADGIPDPAEEEPLGADHPLLDRKDCGLVS